jgi:hypothetical protein
MDPQPLLDSYLRQLRLPMFVKHYQAFAADAAQQQLDYPRYLLALSEQEVQQREQNQQFESRPFPGPQRISRL